MIRPTRGDGVLETNDPVVFIAELVLRTVWLVVKFVFRIGLTVVRHPVAAAVLAAVYAADRWAGDTGTIYGLVGIAMALLMWRLAWHSSFTRIIGRRVSASWRAAQYRFSWQYIATRHGLAAHSYTGGRDDERPTKPEVAKLTKIKATPGMDRLRVKLPTGLNTTHMEKACDGLAHAFRVREVRIAPDKPGWVWIELHRRDVLAPTLRPLPIEQVVDLGAVPIGQHEDGSLWRFRLQGTHVLIAGATGSGKGSVLWSLLRGIAGRISDGSVQVWAVPKGGMELGPGRPLFTRFEDREPDAMCALLEDLVAVKDTRARDLAARGLRKHVPSPESPHLLLLVDELATLTAFADRKVTNRTDQALGLLLTQGRACGITVLAAVQDPGKDVVGWRDLFPTRLAMRLDNPIQVDMVLGDGARDRAARADEISELTPGVAYVRVEGTRQLRRVRATYLSDDDITDLAATHPAPLPAGLADFENDLTTADVKGTDAA